MLQVLLNIFQHGMEVQDAIEAPRVASYSFPSSFAPFEYHTGRLAVEGGSILRCALIWRRGAMM